MFLFQSPLVFPLLHAPVHSVTQPPTYLFVPRDARLMERRVAIHIALADAAGGELGGLGRSGESRCSSSGRGFGVRVLLVVLYEQLDRGHVPRRGSKVQGQIEVGQGQDAGDGAVGKEALDDLGGMGRGGGGRGDVRSGMQRSLSSLLIIVPIGTGARCKQLVDLAHVLGFRACLEKGNVGVARLLVGVAVVCGRGRRVGHGYFWCLVGRVG